MTFTELVEAVARETNKPKYLVADILRVSYEETMKALETGETVVLSGFGSFYSVGLKERPLFGGTRMSGAKRRVRFRLSRRRNLMEKYAVVLDDSKTKTAGTENKCPKCGLNLKRPDYCEKCGTEPFEKKPDQK